MNRSERAIAALLDSYLDEKADRQGLISQNPDQAEDLTAYLAVVDGLRAARPPDPDPETVQIRRREFELQVERYAAERPDAGLLRALRGWAESLFAQTRVAAVALSLVVVVLAGSGVSAAALVAPPGSPLYGYKLTVERAAIQLTDEKDRPATYIELAERRISELTSLGPDASPDVVAKVSASYQMLVENGLEAINSLQSSGDFDPENAIINYEQRVRQHGEQLETFAVDVEPVNNTLELIQQLVSGPLLAGAGPSNGGPAAVPEPTPAPAPTQPPAPTPAPAPAPAPTPAPTPEPTPEPAPEVVEISGEITDIGRGALRIGQTTVLLEAEGHAAPTIAGEPAVGATAKVTGVRQDESTVIARSVEIAAGPSTPPDQPTATPTQTPSTPPTPTDPPPDAGQTPPPTPTAEPTPAPVVALADFEYSGYVQAYDGDTLTIDGRVIFLGGDSDPDAAVTGAELGVGALIEVSGELLSDLRLRARTVSVKVGAL